MEGQWCRVVGGGLYPACFSRLYPACLTLTLFIYLSILAKVMDAEPIPGTMATRPRYTLDPHGLSC